MNTITNRDATYLHTTQSAERRSICRDRKHTICSLVRARTQARKHAEK